MSDKPTFCDLCNGEEELHWEWQTPNEADSVEEALETGKAWFEDNGWIVCDQCHALVLAESWEALEERAVQNMKSKLLCRFDDEGKIQVIDPKPHISNAHSAFRRCRTSYALIDENPLT